MSRTLAKKMERGVVRSVLRTDSWQNIVVWSAALQRPTPCGGLNTVYDAPRKRGEVP